MKRTIVFLLALLLLSGCGLRTGNAGPDPAADHGEPTTGSGAERMHSIRYELGGMKDVFSAVPEAAKTGDLVEIRTVVLYDADIHVYLDNGTELQKSHYDSDYWGYSFTMPDRDVVITAKPYTKSEVWGTGEDEAGFLRDVQYIRTNGYSDAEAYPKIFWISTAEELREYYETNKEKYQLDTSGFAAATERYDASFFEKNDLIFILLEEGSGSIRHEVTGLKVSPSQTDGKQYVLQPEIKRLVPECGTCDMAEWHILIEIGKDHGRSVSELQEPVFTTETSAG